MIVALAGGVGAARFLHGLVHLIDQEGLAVIVNTGDDIQLHGLYISPDLDIITYTLAGIVDQDRGWGIAGDTFNCLRALKRLGHESWFMLGDEDLAIHIHRTQLLNRGLGLTEATRSICHSLGVRATILPMTDQRVETRIAIDKGEVNFQEYLVKRKAADPVQGVRFVGIEDANPAPGVIDSILEADGIIVCPSNPVVSIGSVLAVKGVRTALEETRARIVAISPIVEGAPVKGPADKLMAGLGLEVSACQVAKLYQDFVDFFIIDRLDADLKERIEPLGVGVLATDTIMRGFGGRVRLAKETMALLG